MLNKDIKKKIDDARDTLVGVLPLPTDQIELITIALIYKFMDDQDEELRQVGLQVKFFTGELKEFSWQQLMSNQLSAEGRVTKFINGIEAIQKAKHIPALFREIFLNAFLKFRDGKVLQRFLDIIDGFKYDHSEELGNAFEYLLMTMGAQGDNGQFRTPRNIIDFMVEVVDPTKDETILDPACGTGGFLVSAFKHILRNNTREIEQPKVTLENYVSEGIPIYWGSKLSSIDRSNIEKNIVGYDNTPLMVRLSMVNLYLHHFGNPKIYTYNTLTTETKWKEKFDCILANPPFMTPKGGIETHDKFRIAANRTEILFASYILQHLNADGKASFVVPEGIIFQTSGDYVELRKWLIYELGLWAVVSLPANIFQPYAGVKTSILFIDRTVHRKRNEVLLVNVTNDGFSLNTNRTPIKENDLPEALKWLELCKNNLEQFAKDFHENENPFTKNLRLVHRDEFAKLDTYKALTTVYNFCRKQFEKIIKTKEELELIVAAEKLKVKSVITKEKIEKRNEAIESANKKFENQKKEFYAKTGINFLPITETQLKEWFDENIKQNVIEFGVNLENTNKLTKDILELLTNARDFILSFEKFAGKEPILNRTFEFIQLENICVTFLDGDWIEKEDQSENGIRLIQTGNVGIGKFKNKATDKARYISEEKFVKLNCTEVFANDILVSRLPYPVGRACIIPPFKEKLITSVDCTIIRLDETKMLPKFFIALTLSDLYYKKIKERVTGASRDRISRKNLGSLEIPCPPLDIQSLIVAECDQYLNVMNGCSLIYENYAPTFKVNNEWDTARLIDVADFVRGPFGGSLKKEIFVEKGYKVYEQSHAIKNNFFIGRYFITKEKFGEMKRFEVLPNDVLMSCSGTFGKVALVPENIEKGIINQALLKITPKQDLIRPLFLKLLMETPHFQIQLSKGVSGVAIKNVASVEDIKSFEIKVPDLDTQDKLIEEYEEEQRTVHGAYALANKMQDEIKFVINKVWGR